MAKFIFTGVAFVANARIIVEAHTLGEAVAIIARGESHEVDCEHGDIEYSWADLNSGKEVPEKGET